MESLEQVLARQLRAVSAERGVPLSHLADASGVARSYLWRLLDGSSSATLDMVQRLASVLGVDPRVLVDGMPLTRPSASPSRLVVAEPTPKKVRASRTKPTSPLAGSRTASPGKKPR